jgi:Ca2+-binding EF-hand superfamily protein
LIEGGVSEAEAEKIFAAIDQDHTGRVNYLEFMASTIPSSFLMDDARLKHAFDRMDTDSSGYITPENLKEILGADFDQHSVQKMIAAADYEHDGRISFQEFVKLIRGDRTAVEEDAITLRDVVPVTEDA